MRIETDRRQTNFLIRQWEDRPMLHECIRNLVVGYIDVKKMI